MPICHAKAKHSQEPCKLHATPGMEVCRFHGGKSRLGPGSATFRTGRFSKFLPSRMAADYDASASDPRLMELRDDIAAVDARIIDLLKRVDTGEAGSIWAELQGAWLRLVREQTRGHLESYQSAFNDVGRLITKGAGDSRAWREVGEQFDRKRKQIESEQRRLTLAHESLTADRAMLVLTQVVQILQRHITDRRILGAIAADIQGTLLMRKRDEGYEPVEIGPHAAD